MQRLTSEDRTVIRQAREPVRTAVFSVLLVLIIVGAWFAAASLGYLGALLVGFIASTGLAMTYNATTRTPPSINAAITAGTTACEACDSMQTDQRYLMHDDGSEVLHWVCYACDHHWRVDATS